MNNRTPQSLDQRKRTASLIKQAADALTLLEAEELALDRVSRLALDDLRQCLFGFEITVWGQSAKGAMVSE